MVSGIDGMRRPVLQVGRDAPTYTRRAQRSHGPWETTTENRERSHRSTLSPPPPVAQAPSPSADAPSGADFALVAGAGFTILAAHRMSGCTATSMTSRHHDSGFGRPAHRWGCYWVRTGPDPTRRSGAESGGGPPTLRAPRAGTHGHTREACRRSCRAAPMSRTTMGKRRGPRHP
jgi:hypothetical protein